MIIALFLNRRKEQAILIGDEIAAFLRSRGTEVVFEESLSSIDPKKISYRISLGGDGTILHLLHRFPDIEAPLMGINLGSLGFLADVPLDDIYRSLELLLEGMFEVHQRVVIEGSSSEKKFLAFNEIVFHRGSYPSLIELQVSVDGSYLNTFGADGLIIATPTGSTAYSLAAGGPILSPTLKSLVITPISPHTISNRPIVLLPQKQITVEYRTEASPAEVHFDGIKSLLLKKGDFLSVEISSRTFQVISFSHLDYFSTLRTKLGWSGKLKS